MILEYLKIAINNIKKRSLRSWLTLIGIFIGITAVVSLVGIGQGLQDVVQEEFEDLGANRIIIQTSGSFFGLGGAGDPLTKGDVEVVERVSQVRIASYTNFEVGRMTWGDDTEIGFVMNIPTGERGELLQSIMRSDDLISGSILRDNERGRAILGYDYAHSNRYDTKLTVGRKIYINDKEFEVAGIKTSEGNREDDTQVFINEEDFKELFDVDDEVNLIVAEVFQGRVPAEIVPDIEDALRRHRDLSRGDEDFQVETFEEVLESFLVLLNVINAIIIGIASISLFVGAVGIMNTMYTAVIERTKEIGIMKSIGAKNKDIQNMFLIESGLLGLAGGIIGVLAGIGIGKLVETIAANELGPGLLEPVFPAWLIIGALLFAFILGSISGYYPAKRAAKMNPVDALATE